MSFVKVELRTSVANKALKLMSRRYSTNNQREMQIGLLGEYAVAQWLESEGKTVNHCSVAEMRFAEREGSADLSYMSRYGEQVNVQVKATEFDTCWITAGCLKGYLCRNVHEIYFVDVFINGPVTTAFIYHQTTPQRIKAQWVEVDKGKRLIHPSLHRARRRYTGINQTEEVSK